MAHKIIAIRDAAVAAFGRPFTTPTNGAALRAFQDAVNNPQGNDDMTRHPEDHDLYELGEFDEQTGRITPLEIPKIIAKGKDVKKSASEQ